MNSNNKIIQWSVAAIIVIAAVVAVIVFGNKNGGATGPNNLVAQIGDYKIYQSDINDEIGFQKCLNRELDPTRALGILSYDGFLESVKTPLKTDVAQADIDKEYNTLETTHKTSFMSVDQKALDCLNGYFSGNRAGFDKVVIRPALLDAATQKAFEPSAASTSAPTVPSVPVAGAPLPGISASTTTPTNVFGTNKTFYDWYTGYLISNVKVQIYSPQVCSDFKSLYGDAWFKDLIVCK